MAGLGRSPWRIRRAETSSGSNSMARPADRGAATTAVTARNITERHGQVVSRYRRSRRASFKLVVDTRSP